jgi:hypothetical protein
MANADTSAATFIGLDYKEGMSIIRCNPNPCHLSMATMPKFLVGGYAFHDGRKNTAAYYIHTSHWPETTNSILSSLHHLLFTQWRGTQRPPVLYLMADTHSTNRSRVFLTYCFWLCRYLRLYKEVYLIFTPPYHGKSFVDQAHQGVAAEQKSTEVIASLDKMVEVARRAKGRNFTATPLTDIWDWKTFFGPHMFLPDSISIPGEPTSTKVLKDFLVFHCTYHGVRWKRSLADAFSYSAAYDILGQDPGNVLLRKPPKLFNREDGTIKDSAHDGLAMGLRFVQQTFTATSFAWAQSVLDETWPALSDESVGHPIPTDYQPLHNPPPPTQELILRAGQFCFYDEEGESLPILVRVTQPNPGGSDFRGMSMAPFFHALIHTFLQGYCMPWNARKQLYVEIGGSKLLQRDNLISPSFSFVEEVQPDGSVAVVIPPEMERRAFDYQHHQLNMNNN